MGTEITVEITNSPKVTTFHRDSAEVRTQASSCAEEGMARPAVSGVCCLPGAQVLHVLQHLLSTQPLNFTPELHVQEHQGGKHFH